MAQDPMKIVIVGHVDHGKSTLVGRLLYETDSLQDGQYDELQELCKSRGTDEIEWSFLLDSYQAERDQAVTIDTTQIRFKTDHREYIIIDAPGHREFLKNMISGAAHADTGVLVVDVKEGLQEQTKRHAYLLKLLGLKEVIVVINKIDLVENSQNRFLELSDQIQAYLSDLELSISSILPISARMGHMLAKRDATLSWYQGPTLLEALDSLEPDLSAQYLPLRLPIQDVYRHNEQRILVGRILSGSLNVGDELFFSPMNERAKIASLETWPESNPPKLKAQTGESVAFTLDKPLFVERGFIASHSKEEDLPILSNIFRARLFWLSENDLREGQSFKIRFGTTEASATVRSIEKIIDTQNLKEETKDKVSRNEVAEVTFRTQRILALDPYDQNHKIGRFALYEGHDIAGGGIISMKGYPNQRQSNVKSQNIYEVDHLLTQESRAERNGHQGGVFWFTGLSGAGKSTLAMQVEKRLFNMGYHTYVLDGDNIRHGLCSDLGFSPNDRTENIRRIGEVAALMADAGMIVVTAFISPYRADRDRARNASPELFTEIYVKADLATCEERDPKGLYKKARKGEIREFTGIDSPYEEPTNAELVIDTKVNGIDACVEEIVEHITKNVSLSSTKKQSA